MKKLNEKTWKKFDVFGERGFLQISATSSSIDGIHLKESEVETVPYITRTDSSNGVARFVGKENYKYGSDEAGCITVGLDTQTAFYQPHKFVTGQNIQIVSGDVITTDSAHFYVTILKKQMVAKFNWGGNGATLGRMCRLEAMFPATEAGTPDYKYMQDYTKVKRIAMLKNYRRYIEERISELGKYVELPPIASLEWQPFYVTKIFTKIERGKRLKRADQLPGDVPYVSSTALNNGVDGFIQASKGTRVFCDCISLANSGSVGSAFYEPFDFVASDHVTHLKTEGFNQWIYLFLAVAIEKQKCNFNFNREINDSRVKQMKIMLPVGSGNKPDFKYMEQYAKNMMLRKYKQYLAFLDAREKQHT